MEPFLLSLSATGLAEFGDRTQFLALLLTVRFRKPWAVFGGLVVAAFAIHALSVAVGVALGGILDGKVLGWIVGSLFIVLGLWSLLPESPHTDDRPRETGRGAFLSAAALIFLMEIGDKTQITSMALAARFEALVPVLLGAALGMILVNAPVIWLGDRVAHRIRVDRIRQLAALLFLAIGGWVLWQTAMG